MSRSLKKGAILNWCSLGLYFVTMFLLTPVIIRSLGVSGYGMWTLIQSFSGYYGLVNLGLSSAMIRFVTRDLAAGDAGSLQQTVSTALAFFSGTAAVVLCIAAFIGLPLAHFFNVPASGATIFASTLFFCAIAVVCEFFGGLTTAFLTARERFDLLNGLSMGRSLLQTGGILAVIRYSPSVNGLAAVAAGVGILALIAGLTISARLVPQAKFSWRHARLARLKELLGYGSSTVLLTVTNIVRLKVGSLILAKTANLAAVGVFGVASNLVLNMNSVISTALNVLNPRFTKLDVAGSRMELQQLYLSALFASSAMACWMGLVLFIFSERFILFWIGESMLGAVPIVKVLAFGYIVALAQAPSWNLMFSLAKHHFMARVSFVEACVVLGGGLVLSSMYGAIGFAAATTGAMLLTKLIVQPPFAAKLAGLSLSEYAEPLLVPALVAGVIYAAAFLLGVETMLRHSSFAAFVLAGGVISLLYAAGVAILSIKRPYFPEFVSRRLGVFTNL